MLAVHHQCFEVLNLVLQSPVQQQYAALLGSAEAGADDVERMLGVARFMLSFCTDMLTQNAVNEPATMLNEVLETHSVSRFAVGTLAGNVYHDFCMLSCCSQSCLVLARPVTKVIDVLHDIPYIFKLFYASADYRQYAGVFPPADVTVHEICSSEEQIYFQVCFSNTQSNLQSGKPLASLQMVLQPAAQVKSSRFGKFNAIKVELHGHCTVHLEAAQETYIIELPGMVLSNLDNHFKTLDLNGQPTHSCVLHS